MIDLAPAIRQGRLAKGACLTGVVAGIAGGTAEIAWIVLYGRVFGADAAIVAQGVTQSIFQAFTTPTLAVALGIAIHMGLSILLGLAIAVLLDRFWPHLQGKAFEPIAVTGVLVVVWAVNFFLVLPAINPAFVDLVPYGASLTSKVLFGVAAASVLHFRHKSGPAVVRA